jgi:hypothetical protein
MKPHKHAELIKAWADGAEIQYNHWGSAWKDSTSPTWDKNFQYRIKPEEKQPVVRWLWASKIGREWRCLDTFLTDAEAVQKLNYSNLVTKLEYTRTEFPE